MIKPEVSDKFVVTDAKPSGRTRVTVGSLFKDQLKDLIGKIRATEVHYVRYARTVIVACMNRGAHVVLLIFSVKD